MRAILVKDTRPDPNSRMAHKSDNLEHYLPGPMFTTPPNKLSADTDGPNGKLCCDFWCTCLIPELELDLQRS